MKEKIKKLISKYKNLSKVKKYIVIIIAVLMISVIGLSSAYFMGRIDLGSITNINILSKSTNKLVFINGEEISIIATQDNFYQNAGNLEDTTVAKARLKAGYESEAEYNYNTFFIIDENNYIYTTNEKKAELIMKVIDPLGNEVTSIPGIHYVTVGDVSGFDITESYGSFAIAEDYVISTNSEIIQEWSITVYYINLESNQKANEGHIFSGRIYMTTEDMTVYTLPVVNTIRTNVNNGIELDIEVATTQGTASIDKYYYGIEENNEIAYQNNKIKKPKYKLLSSSIITYEESVNNTYQFSNLTPEQNYRVYTYTKDINGFNSVIYSSNITTNRYNYSSVEEIVISNATEYGFTITPSIIVGTGSISKYYYSIDNGETWSEEGANSKTYSNLTPGETYNVKVKVKDTNNMESEEYGTTATTIYNKPRISNVEVDNITNTSLKINVTAAPGTYQVGTYYYSINNVESYPYTSTTNTKTITGLTPGTLYNIRVYVKDNNEGNNNPNRESIVYQTTGTTTYTNPSLTSASITEVTTNSFKINITSSGGSNAVTTYWYSLNNGAWISSNVNPIAVTNLNSGTTYSIKVKVKDSLNYESNEINTSQKTNSTVTLLAGDTTITGKDYTLTNIIENGSFEQGATGWTSGNANIAPSTEEHYSGLTSIKNAGAPAWTWIKPTTGIDAIASHVYYFSVMQKTANLGNYFCYDQVNIIYNSNNHWSTQLKSLNTNIWEKLSDRFTVPNVTSPIIRPALTISRSDNGQQICYVDDALLIDLTTEFGSSINNYSKEWLDANVDYFDETMDIKTNTISTTNTTFTVVPLSGYINGTTVTCDNGATGVINGNTITISNVNGNNNCKIKSSMDLPVQTLIKLGKNINDVNFIPPNFAVSATTNEGLFAAQDDYGTSYYFRGAVDNNWVKFNNMYWRIIRINGDGSIRMIYSGITAPTYNERVIMKNSSPHLSNGYQIYNDYSYNNECLGYKYTMGEQHGSSRASNAYTTIKNWYNDIYTWTDTTRNKLADVIYCNDRTTYSGTLNNVNYTGNGIGTVDTWFGAARRLISSTSVNELGTGPSLICPTKSDAFTVSDRIKGNGALEMPVGLITADEAKMSGITNENKTYLYTSMNYFTLSPYNSYVANPSIFSISAGGGLSNFYISVGAGIRPVISLKPDVTITGSGTWNDYYVIN